MNDNVMIGFSFGLAMKRKDVKRNIISNITEQFIRKHGYRLGDPSYLSWEAMNITGDEEEMLIVETARDSDQ